MANRTTSKSNIVTKCVPTVTNAIMIDMLNSDLADNVRYREDVAVSQSSATSSITVDFTGKDRVDLTRTGGSLSITVSGIGDGEQKFLLITKTPGQAVTWVGVTDVTPIKENADAISIVLYELIRKGSYTFAKAWVETVVQATDTVKGIFKIASQAENNALSNLENACVPGRLPLTSETQRGLTRLATNAEVTAGTAGVAAQASQLRSEADNLLSTKLFATRMIFGTFNSAGTTLTIWKGTLTASVSKLGTGFYRITHNIGHYNYIVLGVGTAHSPFASIRTNENKAPTTVDIVTSDDETANDSEQNFVIIIFD